MAQVKCGRRHLTSCLNGKITVGHRFAIIANHYFPLSKALGFLENPSFYLRFLANWRTRLWFPCKINFCIESQVTFKFVIRCSLVQCLTLKFSKLASVRLTELRSLLCSSSVSRFTGFNKLIGLRLLLRVQT